MAGMTDGPRLGVALGGGAARGAAHVGALIALEESGHDVDVIAGTSYGAVIAALYALGGPAIELERVIRTQNIGELWTQAFDFGLHRGALINGRRLANWLDRKFFFGATFADTQVPLAVACTDLASGELVVLREGSIADAVRASCAVPTLFAPVKLAGRVLIDGGFVEAVPFAAANAMGPAVSIGVHAGVDVSDSPVIRTIRRFNRSAAGSALQRLGAAAGVGGPLSQAVRGLAISFASYERRLAEPDGAHLIATDPRVAWWDFHRSPDAIGAGRAAMLAALERLPVADEPGLAPRRRPPRSAGRPGARAPGEAK